MTAHFVGLLARVPTGSTNDRARSSTQAAPAIIAHGGMGFVELCGRKRGPFIKWVARKRMHTEWRVEPEFRRMFYDEGRLAHLVRNKHVVRVRQFGEDADGPFLIMDYVEGVPLSKVFRRLTKTAEVLPLHLAVDIGHQVALGLHAAHEVRAPDGSLLDLVHRDVSPNNILVGFDGTVRLTDFGIAKARDNLGHTSLGLVKGTPGYVSPEQLQFQDTDRRADLFALGVVVYELLTGRRLYGGTRQNARVRVLFEEPPDVTRVRSEVPRDLAELVRELLAKSPSQRPPTAEAVACRFNQILDRLKEKERRLDLASYVNLHFRSTKARLQSLTSAHRSRVKAESTLVTSTPDELATTVGIARERPLAAAAREHRWRLWGIALLLLALVAAKAGHPPTLQGKPLAVSTQTFAPDIVPLPLFSRAGSGQKVRVEAVGHRRRTHHQHRLGSRKPSRPAAARK